MGIDIHIIFLFVESGLLESELDTFCLGGSVRPWSCRMISIASVAVSYHLSIDLRSTCLCMLQFLENEHSGTVAHYETSTVCIERK